MVEVQYERIPGPAFGGEDGDEDLDAEPLFFGVKVYEERKDSKVVLARIKRESEVVVGGVQDRNRKRCRGGEEEEEEIGLGVDRELFFFLACKRFQIPDFGSGCLGQELILNFIPEEDKV